MKMVVKTIPTMQTWQTTNNNNNSNNPVRPMAGVARPSHPHRPATNRPATNRLQAHLSKMAQRSTTTHTSSRDPTRPTTTNTSNNFHYNHTTTGASTTTTTIVSASNDTFISPMTADLTETEDDYQFQTIRRIRQDQRSCGSSSPEPTTEHTSTAPSPPRSDTSTTKQEEPPGRNNNDDALWYPLHNHHNDNNDGDETVDESNEPPAIRPSTPSPPRFRPSLDVYSPTARDTSTDEHEEEEKNLDHHHYHHDEQITTTPAAWRNNRRFDDPIDHGTTMGRSKSWDDIHEWMHQPQHPSLPQHRHPDHQQEQDQQQPYPPPQSSYSRHQDPTVTNSTGPPRHTNMSVEEAQAVAALSPTAQKYYFYDNHEMDANHRSGTNPPNLLPRSLYGTTALSDRDPIHQLQQQQQQHDRRSSEAFSSLPGYQPADGTTTHCGRPLSHLQDTFLMTDGDGRRGGGDMPATPTQKNDADGNGTTTMDYQWTTSLPPPPQQQRLFASTLHRTYPMNRLWSDPVVETTRTMANAAMMMVQTASAGNALRKSQSFDQPVAPTTTEMSQLQQPQLLSWRMDPNESLSDWKIQAFDRSTKQFTTYHVHKVVLCVGSRACGYFTRQQQQQQQQGKEPYHHHATTVQLPLIRKACELLPQLLDFCYSTPFWEVTRETAVGLVFLATYLDQPQLKSMAMEFVYNDLSPVGGKDDDTTVLVGSVLHHYLAEAVYFDQDELVEFLLELCATHLLEMNAPARLLDELSPPQFLAVLRQIPKRASARLSTLVVDYCVSHRLELTLPFVETCACLCPILATDTALALLELYLTLGGGTEGNYCYHVGVDGSSTTNSGIDLLHRCLKVLAEDSAALLSSPETLPSLVNQILDVCPPLLGPWMRDMLHQAQKQGTQVQADLRGAWEQQALMRDELIEVNRALEQAQKERQQLQKTLESTKLELRQQLDGWMSKSHRDSTEHVTRQAIWQEDRDLWRLERQAWMEERGALEHELYRLRAQLNRQREVSEMNKHKRRHSSKSKEDFGNPCPQVQAQGILNYLSNVGMPGPAEEVSMQVSDDDSFSSELNTIDPTS